RRGGFKKKNVYAKIFRWGGFHHYFRRSPLGCCFAPGGGFCLGGGAPPRASKGKYYYFLPPPLRTFFFSRCFLGASWRAPSPHCSPRRDCTGPIYPSPNVPTQNLAAKEKCVGRTRSSPCHRSRGSRKSRNIGAGARAWLWRCRMYSRSTRHPLALARFHRHF